MPHSQKVLKTIQSLETSPCVYFPADLRQRLIAEAAYFKSERRGFAPGFEGQDWAEAEKEIDGLLRAENSFSRYAL